MNSNPRQTRFAYVVMIAFMALSTAALAAASASGGYDRVVESFQDTVQKRIALHTSHND